MKRQDGVEIIDCLGKELFVVYRYGGDIIMEFYDYRCVPEELKEKLSPVYITLFRMRRNSKRNWEKIKEHFIAIKQLLVEPKRLNASSSS